ncbi:MAG: transglutaminase domain-containing protein [Bacteroidia bacterium]
MNFRTIIKRVFLLFIVSAFPYFSFAQENDSIAEKIEPAAVNTNSINIFDSATAAKYKKVDEFVLSMKKRNKKTPVLAKEITAPFTSEEEKVRALFVWITNNISYDCVAYHQKNAPSGNFSYKTQEELLRKLDLYYSNVAALTLRNKKAVCEGYAVLFREFCKANGINCLLVEGRASENKDKIKKLRSRKSFSTNHTWNKVQVNGVWYYIDVTWASGYCDKAVKKFYKKFNSFYFLTPVDNLYPTHAENIKFTDRRNNPTTQ